MGKQKLDFKERKHYAIYSMVEAMFIYILLTLNHQYFEYLIISLSIICLIKSTLIIKDYFENFSVISKKQDENYSLSIILLLAIGCLMIGCITVLFALNIKEMSRNIILVSIISLSGYVLVKNYSLLLKLFILACLSFLLYNEMIPVSINLEPNLYVDIIILKIFFASAFLSILFMFYYYSFTREKTEYFFSIINTIITIISLIKIVEVYYNT